VTTRIADHGIVGDCRSAALISRGGSCDWLCWPRFDSPSVFAAILDEERGGRFQVAPMGLFESVQEWLGETNVLVTRFTTQGASLTLTDFMPVQTEADARSILSPEHELVRVLHCERGAAEIEITFDPRPDYGRARVRITSLGKLGLRVAMPGGGLLTLLTDAGLGASGRSRVLLRAGERLTFSLTFAHEDAAVLPPPGVRCLEVLENTVKLWHAWAARTRYDGPHRAEVVRSALLLKLLQYAPSGAIVAAPTTSLPERPGGDLNWDYRFCWLRDAALTSRALFGLGHSEEAESFMSWLLNATTLSLPKLNVLYDLFGRQPGAERVLTHLRGHGGARPVRIGNGAKDQVQLDTYGEVIEAVAHVVRRGKPLGRSTAEMLVGFGLEIARGWERPDAGIWEERGSGSAFVHSRVLCWDGLQRLIELGEKGYLPRRAPIDVFVQARDRIHEQIETLGYSEQLQSYTRTLGGSDVDASLLLLPWYGYCDAGSPRMQGTWRRIQAQLGAGNGLLHRYLGPLTKGEGAFGICGFWAAEFLALGGGSWRGGRGAVRLLAAHRHRPWTLRRGGRPRDARSAGKLSPGLHPRRFDQRRALSAGARPAWHGRHRSQAPVAAGGAPMNWPLCLLAGFAGTLVLTALEAAAQQLRMTRMSIPFLLGTMFTPDRDRAKLYGLLAHLANGQLFALLYVALFHATGAGGVVRGASIGLLHAAVVLLVAVPLLPAMHPRMASLHQGPVGTRVIEPPGPFALHYGFATPLMVVVSHAIFGAVVGGLFPG